MYVIAKWCDYPFAFIFPKYKVNIRKCELLGAFWMKFGQKHHIQIALVILEEKFISFTRECDEPNKISFNTKFNNFVAFTEALIMESGGLSVSFFPNCFC